MLIPSSQIPQADNLLDVLRTVISVSQGSRTFQDIAHSIGKVDRQGRYYRKAAEILGLISTPSRNHSILTPLGEEFIRTGAVITNPIFIQSVLNIRLFQRIIPFLELNITQGVTRDNITEFISRVSNLAGDSMAHRRLSSVVSWLDELNLIERRGDRFYFNPATVINNINMLDFTDIDEPILPRSNNLNEYQTVSERTERARETITILRDSATLDRAVNAHSRLVNLVAKRIRASNHIPRYNQLIDLATRINNSDYIFEMKSLTPRNARSQVRKGLSQLYEYQYLQNLPNSNLVLVVENPLPPNSIWMIDYLESTRNINLIWDGNGNLYGTQQSRDKFDFLNLLSA
ncbi:MAG: hypothetical protein K8F60_16345 [Melioribacteraceae bacterium]|nr:hypothetical protein [Melioribacteraceae bacterium]